MIYGCGDKSLLQNGGLAVVGSRDADEQSRLFSCAKEELQMSDVNLEDSLEEAIVKDQHECHGEGR